MPIHLQTRTGQAITPIIPALAALRCTVFREYPYLYEGDEAYEKHYLTTYQRSQSAAVIVAWDNDIMVGASTCLPMEDAEAAIQSPLQAKGIDTKTIFYFGESVLLAPYRNQGIGVAFFEAREAQARKTPATKYTAFASVIRPENHPARPPEYRPLDAFWTRRGYTSRPDLVCRLSWKDLNYTEQTEKHLVFWMKSLNGAPLP